MITVYAAYRNWDTTEGRGPMVLDKAFKNKADADTYIDGQGGVMGRKAKWSQEKYGDWRVEAIRVFESLDDATKDHDRELRKSALAKLSDDERRVLGV